MKRAAPIVALLAGLLASCAVGPAPAARPAPRDRLEIQSVKFLNASSPEFVVFVVRGDYQLASSAEGNVGLALELEPGKSTLVSEQRVQRGAGAVELMAACKRAGPASRVVSLSLSEFPGGPLRRTFATQMRAVTLPAAP